MGLLSLSGCWERSIVAVGPAVNAKRYRVANPTWLTDDEITISMAPRHDYCAMLVIGRGLLLSGRSNPYHLDFPKQICNTLPPISRAAAGELPPTHAVGGMTENPMRCPRPYPIALSVANARSFHRPCKRDLMGATIHGSVLPTRREARLRQTA
jgi:hypothetical protein